MTPSRGRAEGRPSEVFDAGLQHERTALAWERTAIAAMVAGVLLTRYASESFHPVFAAVGMLQVAFGSAVLLWAALHYDDLHGPLRSGQSPVHPTAARVVGFASVVFTAAATTLAAIIAFT